MIDMNDKKRYFIKDGFSISELKAQADAGEIVKKSLSLNSIQTALNNKPLEKAIEGADNSNNETKNNK